MDNTALTEAFKAARGQARLARSLGLAKQTIQGWKRRGSVPAKHASSVEEKTGVSRDRLCPGVKWEVATEQPPGEPGGA